LIGCVFFFFAGFAPAVVLFGAKAPLTGRFFAIVSAWDSIAAVFPNLTALDAGTAVIAVVAAVVATVTNAWFPDDTDAAASTFLSTFTAGVAVFAGAAVTGDLTIGTARFFRNFSATNDSGSIFLMPNGRCHPSNEPRGNSYVGYNRIPSLRFDGDAVTGRVTGPLALPPTAAAVWLGILDADAAESSAECGASEVSDFDEPS